MADSAVPVAVGERLLRPLARRLHHRRAALRQARDPRLPGQHRHLPGAGQPELRVQGPPARPPGKLSAVIDLKRLRQDPEASRASLLRRRDPSVGPLLDALLDLDRQRRELLVQVESLKAERNAASEEVARRKRAKEPADDLMARLKAIGRRGQGARRPAPRRRGRARPARPRGAQFPGGRASPDGDASANRVVRTWGEPPDLRRSRRGRTGSWAPRSAFSICPPAPSSPARASRCFAGSARGWCAR